jgi:phage shock protein C
MYCVHCAKELREEERFCSACGGARPESTGFSRRRDGVELTRPRQGKRIAGVCAGVARYFDLDVTLVRIVWFVLVFVPPVPGIIAYIACWIAMPKDPDTRPVAVPSQATLQH